MLVSLNWIRDYVDVPPDLDPRALAERFSVTTAEVDDVHEVRTEARGVIAAKIQTLKPSARNASTAVAVLELGEGKFARAVTTIKGLTAGATVLFAPHGTHLAAFGEIHRGESFGEPFDGVIVPGDAVGVQSAVQETIMLGPEFPPGNAIAGDLFDDWLIEIDNKSLTNRPDLWGHYGVAREIAAILRKPLKPLPVVSATSLTLGNLSKIPIAIADAKACPRYSAIIVEDVPTQPAPLWMQLRLGRIGMRPISGLVDLTNYVMADLGQPMHAFDAARVNRIEADWARAGERFRTLDGVERVLTASDLMIKSGGKSVGLAGVMGGLETEVSQQTTSLLLESANFEGAAVRRTAKRLNLRSEASARFEKSLDPANTVLGIQRFMQLAQGMYPKLRLASQLSDGYPTPVARRSVAMNPGHVTRTIGRQVPLSEAHDVLSPLGFEVAEQAGQWTVNVPSHRATGDISIEADVIEEIARRTGYDAIKPAAPQVTVRHFAPNVLRELEKTAFAHFTAACGFNEIYGYIWYDGSWLTQIGYDPGASVELKNPAAEGMNRLRGTLLPGLLAATARNRFHFSSMAMIEVGSVFHRAEDASYTDAEFRNLGLVLARKGKNLDGELLGEMKGALQSWCRKEFDRAIIFNEVSIQPGRPWEHPQRMAGISIDGRNAGRLSVVDLPLRRKMDEHLSAWGIAWAELQLSGLEGIGRRAERLDLIPAYPRVEMDFSLVASKITRYAEIADKLGRFVHPLLRRMRYVTSFEGGSLARDRRSHTFRVVIGDASRTLTDDDTAGFQAAFVAFLSQCGYELRAG